MNDRLDQQISFLTELDKEKMIERKTELSDNSRPETDAEHAWHMAVMALILSEYANSQIDLIKVLSMVLLHDVVEIDAGDTYAYDTEGLKTQEVREMKAADRLYGLLPPDQEEHFRAIWEEFEEGKTPEARFAKALDNLQPAMITSAGGGRGWKDRKVLFSQILKRNEITPKGSEVLWDYSLSHFLTPNVISGQIEDDVKKPLVEEKEEAKLTSHLDEVDGSTSKS